LSGSWIAFLGTSAGTPTPTSWFPSILVFHSGIYLLLDAGEGAQIRLLQKGVGPPKIDVIAVTHMHGDHLFGLPGLLQTMEMSARKRALHLMGPIGISEFLDSVFRLTGFEAGFDINVIAPPRRLEVSRVNGVIVVEPFEVCHVGDSYGYRVEALVKGRGGLRSRFSLAYTGDTRPCRKYLEKIMLTHALCF